MIDERDGIGHAAGLQQHLTP